jgi:hypothetical protein
MFQPKQKLLRSHLLTVHNQEQAVPQQLSPTFVEIQQTEFCAGRIQLEPSALLGFSQAELSHCKAENNKHAS